MHVLATLHIADLFRDRRMVVPTRLDYRKIPRILAGDWPIPLPASDVVPACAPVRAIDRWVVEAPGRDGYIAVDTEFTRDGKQLELIGLGYPGMDRALQIQWPQLDADEKRHCGIVLAGLFRNTPVVFQNLVADIPVLAKDVGIALGGYTALDDTMLAHAALWSDWPHELAFLASLYSPHAKAKHLARWDPLKYNLGDVCDTIATWEALKKELNAAPALKKVYREQSMSIAPHLIKAHQHGIRVNKPRVEPARLDYENRKAVSQTLARQYTGVPDFNVGSAAQMKEWLYEVESFPAQHAKGKSKGPISVDEDAIAILRGLAEPVPDLDAERETGVSLAYVLERVDAGAHSLLEARLLYMAAQQAHSHYILPCCVVGGKGRNRRVLGMRERVYPQFKIHAQATGRWSTTDPPLAQLPADLEDILAPDAGFAWLSWDWKAIEKRVLQAESQSAYLKAIFDNGWDQHLLNMCAIFGLPVPPNRSKASHPDNAAWRQSVGWSGNEKQDDIRRTFSKRFSFRMDYGGAATGAKDIPGAKVLGLDGPRLVDAANAYFNADPDYKRWRRMIVAKSLAAGEVTTFTGRRRKLFWGPEENARIAMNTPMQAGVADVFNTVWVRIQQSLGDRVQWVYGVHDRQIWACRSEEVDELKPQLQEIAEMSFDVRGHKTVFPIDWKAVRHGV